MARNGAGTGSPPIEHRPRAHHYQDRGEPYTPAVGPGQGQGSQGQRGQVQRTTQLTEEQRAEWKGWLETIFAQKGWRQQLPSGRWQGYYAEFDRRAGLLVGTMNQYVHRGYVPSPTVVQRMAAALGISPLAIMYRSFQITFDQLAALLGPSAYVLVTEEQTRASLDALAAMTGLPESYRVQLEHKFREDYRFSQELRKQLVDRWREQLAFSEAEVEQLIEQLRVFLTERGKEQTRRDVLADATPLADPRAEAEPREQVFAHPLAPAAAQPFAPESAAVIESPAAQAPHRRPPADSPVWQEEDEGVGQDRGE